MDENDEEFWQPERRVLEARMPEIDAMRHNEAEEPMSLGESITLLIAVGVLLYLIYALLWPERF